MNKLVIKTVNDKGIEQIRQWLGQHHKRAVTSGKGANYFSDSQLYSWATHVEYRMDAGDQPTLGLAHYQSLAGKNEEFTLTDDGINTLEVDEDEENEE